MANENTPKQQGSVDNTSPDATSAQTGKKGAAKESKPRVGGSAVPGAKSTQPRPTPAGNPQEQQLAGYSRVMRRRMERMGTYDSEKRMQNVYDQRRKRVERRKQKLEEARADIRKSTPAGRIRLGRGNLYFVIGVVVLIVIVILFAVLRSLHII